MWLNMRTLSRFYTVHSQIASRSKLKQFPDLFHGVGCIYGEISIKLCKGAIPHTKPIRRVPHAMQKPLKAELDKLWKEGILHKVDTCEPIEWLNSFVCMEKPNGKIRLCLDLMHLNKWIIRPRHSAKLVVDTLHKLHGAIHFTMVDSTSSFYNQSWMKIQLNTPLLVLFGCYRY